MREILFRGKSLDNRGAWVVGSLIHRTDFYGDPCDDYFILHGGEFDCDYYDADRVDPKTVGQFTGLTDKNGTKIFEGDIVEHHIQGDILVNRGVVNWDEESARWAYQLNTMNPCFALYNPNAFEVIGNIHDNPELLKE